MEEIEKILLTRTVNGAIRSLDLREVLALGLGDSAVRVHYDRDLAMWVVKLWKGHNYVQYCCFLKPLKQPVSHCLISPYLGFSDPPARSTERQLSIEEMIGQLSIEEMIVKIVKEDQNS